MTPEHIQSLSTAQLRDAASDCWRAHDWSGLLELLDRLRQDAHWPVLWSALCSVGARHLGRADARELLREAILSGFVEVRLLQAEIQEAFGADDDWPQIAAAIAANQPPQPFELTRWPVDEPMWPLDLCRISAEREEALLSRLPQRQPTAWQTAIALLAWVATRWIHANHRAHGEDALQILDRVAEGVRFAGPEFATVLSHALNAHRIPARCVSMHLATYHGGIGRGHIATEAWIDDLGRWVLLDAQNGLFWCDQEGTPLGLAELRWWKESSQPRPEAVCLARPIGERRLEAWWDYAAGPSGVAGRLWSTARVGLMCEGQTLATGAVQPDARGLYPRLDLPSIGLTPAGDLPALVFGCVHPYATGFYVRADSGTQPVDLAKPIWQMRVAPPGEHTIHVGVCTAYGRLRAEEVCYQTA